MALDLEGRRRARCDFKDCPFDAKVIDLTGGDFVVEADKVFHGSCYATRAGRREERAGDRQKREADEALDAEVAKVRRDRELAAAQATYDAQVAAWKAENPGRTDHPFGPRPGSAPASVASASVAEVTRARLDQGAPPARALTAGDMPDPEVGTFATPGVPG